MSAETDFAAIKDVLEHYKQQVRAMRVFPALEALDRLAAQHAEAIEAVKEARDLILNEYGKHSVFTVNLPKCAALLAKLNTPFGL